MRKRFSYDNGLTVMEGDIVQYKKHFWKSIQGVVTYIYNPDEPSPPWGNNDHGFEVKLSDGSYILCDSTKGIHFVSRGSTKAGEYQK